MSQQKSKASGGTRPAALEFDFDLSPHSNRTKQSDMIPLALTLQNRNRQFRKTVPRKRPQGLDQKPRSNWMTNFSV